MRGNTRSSVRKAATGSRQNPDDPAEARARGALPLRLFLQLVHERLFVRELVRLELRVHEPAIDVDVEDTAFAPYQCWLDAECILELGSQTGRRWQVVSGAAVCDANIHPTLSYNR